MGNIFYMDNNEFELLELQFKKEKVQSIKKFAEYIKLNLNQLKSSYYITRESDAQNHNIDKYKETKEQLTLKLENLVLKNSKIFKTEDDYYHHIYILDTFKDRNLSSELNLNKRTLEITSDSKIININLPNMTKSSLIIQSPKVKKIIVGNHCEVFLTCGLEKTMKFPEIEGQCLSINLNSSYDFDYKVLPFNLPENLYGLTIDDISFYDDCNMYLKDLKTSNYIKIKDLDFPINSLKSNLVYIEEMRCIYSIEQVQCEKLEICCSNRKESYKYKIHNLQLGKQIYINIGPTYYSEQKLLLIIDNLYVKNNIINISKYHNLLEYAQIEIQIKSVQTENNLPLLIIYDKSIKIYDKNNKHISNIITMNKEKLSIFTNKIFYIDSNYSIKLFKNISALKEIIVQCGGKISSTKDKKVKIDYIIGDIENIKETPKRITESLFLQKIQNYIKEFKE